MFSFILRNISETIGSIIQTIFFIFSVYIVIPILYGGVEFSLQTTVFSIIYTQPFNWWINRISETLTGLLEYFAKIVAEYIVENLNPFVVPKIFCLLQNLGGI